LDLRFDEDVERLVGFERPIVKSIGVKSIGRREPGVERKRHSKKEITALLLRADELAAQGKLQKDIARTLGVSVMTLHRWRKSAGAPAARSDAEPAQLEADTEALIDELERENARLRVLVTDLLLEKARLEEALKVPRAGRVRNVLGRLARA
jgi:putative transposase